MDIDNMERVIPAHRVILAATSKFFEAKIKRWMDDASAPGQADKRAKLKMECDDHQDLEAAEACIRTMYLQRSPLEDAPNGWDVDTCLSFLLKVAAWGDLWQADCVARYCRSGLARLTEDKDVQARHINTLLSELPSSLQHESEEHCGNTVVRACSRWLLGNFEDVHRVITDDEKRHSFCGLYPSAVVLWAEMDDLFGCENDVAIALAHWSCGEQGRKCEPEVFRRLSLSIRVSNLTKTFRNIILPGLSFFTEHEMLRHVNFADSECTFRPDYGKWLDVYTEWDKWKPRRNEPRRWLRGSMRGMMGFTGDIDHCRNECIWRIPGDLILNAEKGESQLGPSLYINGFLLRLYLVVWCDHMTVHVAPQGSEVSPKPGLVKGAMSLSHDSPSGLCELAEVGRMHTGFRMTLGLDDDDDGAEEYFDEGRFRGKIRIKFDQPDPLRKIVNRDGMCVIILRVRDVQ
ncbi:hypothetical protein DUNSADRAFT_1203 [Dunaliella salina]|uniref:BTB domain-containing protein n=1 Tax=Dunaliella salina TaxID=3046 RepID=A0ABQ7GXD3_DUNSA|nr:hypothetical protein DUNSADRAFT_1203 [Dunaliella salina]|eukprot:KAF5839259.1 hypothetical protein DUNSADRAFT_1203 [Dunaliella salina]